MIEGDKPLDRACGILLGTIGIFGCIIPLVKNKNLKEAFQLSITGIGVVLSIYSVISKTTTTKV